MFGRARLISRPANFRPLRQPQIVTRRYASSAALQRWAPILNVITAAYAGGLIICSASLFLLYRDAVDRQNIPFEIGVNNTVTAVKAIGKDDVLESPRYAVKHYRRLLIELAKKEDPALEFDETLPDGLKNYTVPLLSSDVLLQKKSKAFANFYVDIVLRYARALLAKGLLRNALALFKGIADDDEIFNYIGDPEKMSQCCRTLSRVTDDPAEQFKYLERSIAMLSNTFQSIRIDQDFLLQDDSQLTDELLLSLNALAFCHAKYAPTLPRKQQKQELTKALNIYLANLKALTTVKDRIVSGERSQASYPLIDCDVDGLNMSLAEIKAHISEILWATNHKESAIAWSEEIVHDIYFEHSRNARASPILDGVLGNLQLMYTKTKRFEESERCEALRKDLNVFDKGQRSWYDNLIRRFTRIIYHKGPLGVIEKALKERVGPVQPLPDIESYEDEDEE